MNSKLKVLIIEDEALIAENLRATLEDLHYAVTDICYNYQQALEALAGQSVDLVLLDINLGSQNQQENGLSLAQLLNQHYQIPFIFLTAYNDLDTISRATKLKPSGYLIKPVNGATLFAAIQTAIEYATAPNKDSSTIAIPAPPPDFLFVKVGNRNLKLLWQDILCIESGKNYVTLRSTNGKLVIPIRGTLTFVLTELIPQSLRSDFIRINRGICLNKNNITSYTGEAVYCGKERFENTRFSLKELQALLE